MTIFIDDSYENECSAYAESSAGKDFAIGGLQWSMGNRDRENAVIKWIWTVLELVSENDQVTQQHNACFIKKPELCISSYSL